MKKLVLAAICTTIMAFAMELTESERALLERSTKDYWEMVYPPEVPRACDVHRDGCPVCGDAIKKHGMYAWILDPKKPFKIKCPECGSVFPDNDFEAYMKSGFKDKSLLTGKYVDDGRGWRPAEGQPKYWFVAYYNHWTTYQCGRAEECDCARLALAYKRTGEPAFARRALAWFDHFADYYPDYNYNKQSRYAEEVLPTYNGRFLNAIWEALFTSRLADEYLIIRDFLETEDEELTAVTGKTSAQIRKNIEENLFRTVAKDVSTSNGKNAGNYGMHQRALLKAAKILNEPSYAHWVTDFRVGGDMPLDYAFYNCIFGDGAPLEAPGYNVDWIDTFMGMFPLLKENGIDEFANHKVLDHIFKYGSKLMVCGKFFAPASGDSGYMGNIDQYTGLFASNKMYYEQFPSPYSARMLMFGAQRFDKELYEKLSKEADMDFGYDSNLLPAYGIATLQNGDRQAPTAVALAFPHYYGHMHYDMLHLDFFAENTSLIPDFGYPDSASSDDPTLAYYLNSVAHNTVVVNASRQQYARNSILNQYDSGDFAQFVSAEGKVYAETSQYCRSDLVCNVAPGKTLVFDVFDVNGGKQHDWFMHSSGETFSANKEFTAQEGGTLAGNDVPYGRFFDSAVHQQMLESGLNKNFYNYSGSGFQFLTNVRYADETSDMVITLPADKCKEETPLPGAALKMHLLDEAGTVYISQGKPPVTQANPQKHVMFVSRRRMGAEPLKSRFTTLLENTSDARSAYDVVSVEMIPAGNDTVAAKVTLKDGRLLYVFIADKSADFTWDGYHFRGHAGALLLENQIGKAYVNGEGGISKGDVELLAAGPDFEATITQVNLEEESIELDKPVPQSLIGHMFKCKEFAYQIERIEGNKLWLKEQTMLRGRARILKHASDDKKSGALVPCPKLLKNGLALYKGEDKSQFVGIGELKDANSGLVETNAELELNIDYWLSECAPGDRIISSDSARTMFEVK